MMTLWTAVLIEIKESPRDAHLKLNISVSISGVEANALVDISHLSDRLAKRLKFKLESSNHCV